MNSENQFASLEIMCRERAALAKKEMEYWLAEAEEWKRFKESSGPSRERESILRATRLARRNQQSLNSHASISESARQSSKGCWTIVNRLRVALGGSPSEPDQYNTGRHSRPSVSGGEHNRSSHAAIPV